MNWFSNAGNFDALREECGDPDGFPESESKVLFCRWDEEDYEGNFYMLFERGGQLFEQEMGHCSCNSYDQDWGSWMHLKPVNGAYLKMRQRPFYRRDETPELLVAWDAVLETYGG